MRSVHGTGAQRLMLFPERALPGVKGRGDAYYRGLAAAAASAGAAVVHARAVRTPDTDRYMHKVNPHAVVRPYLACLSLGSLSWPGTILAIGQSRHLGGGLLVPFDVPEGVAGVPVPQVVEVSATPDEDGTERAVVAVDSSDLSEQRLAARLTRPKPVRLIPVAEWPPSRQVSKTAAAIARAAVEIHHSH